MRHVGEGFYTFNDEFLGSDYELRKCWVTKVEGNRYRSVNLATESEYEGPKLPWCSAETKEEAFRIGKRERLESLRRAEEAVRAKFKKDMAKLRQDKAKLRALTLKKTPVRGDNETYEQFKRGWDCDF